MRLLIILTLIILAGRALPQQPGSLGFKLNGSDSVDLTLKYGVQRTGFGYSFGYGQLFGSRFNATTQGYQGSGFNYSGFSTMNSQWLSLRQQLAPGQSLLGSGYGKNGINAELSGLLGKTMTYGAAYSGQTNVGAIYFGSSDKSMAAIGSTLLSGKGYLITKDNKLQEGRLDFELRF